MANYTKNLRLVFAEENKEFNVKCCCNDMDELISHLIDYGIYAEELVHKKPNYRRKYIVFGIEYASMREFAESNGVEDTSVYRFNNKFLGEERIPKYKMMEYYLATVIAKHANVDSYKTVWGYLKEGMRNHCYEALQLDKIKEEVCFYYYDTKTDDRLSSQNEHIKEFYFKLKNIIDNLGK